MCSSKLFNGATLQQQQRQQKVTSSTPQTGPQKDEEEDNDLFFMAFSQPIRLITHAKLATMRHWLYIFFILAFPVFAWTHAQRLLLTVGLWVLPYPPPLGVGLPEGGTHPTAAP